MALICGMAPNLQANVLAEGIGTIPNNVKVAIHTHVQSRMEKRRHFFANPQLHNESEHAENPLWHGIIAVIVSYISVKTWREMITIDLEEKSNLRKKKACSTKNSTMS